MTAEAQQQPPSRFILHKEEVKLSLLLRFLLYAIELNPNLLIEEQNSKVIKMWALEEHRFHSIPCFVTS